MMRWLPEQNLTVSQQFVGDLDPAGERADNAYVTLVGAANPQVIQVRC